jgi:serine/threonine protein kinase/TolB-like protein/Flp pilus assembly protein TadD
MPLMPGTQMGHYRVLSVIGAGGMAEVYLAEDLRLGRKVALKLLSHDYGKDADRLRRFEQEARAASALNHPNIITIYEIGETDRAQFIAMEYIEGETLRARLKRGPLEASEALDVAIQVASALKAAHASGIVHRDIKPENIMLRPDGYVKVLDFGIVKLTEKFTERGPADSGPSQSKTASLVETDPGIVIGSPYYMSPEQARGLEVDARTDIFSLGAVLYEMLAGKKPFMGDTISDVIVSVLERDPPPVTSYAPGVPARLAEAVSDALVKNKHERCQTAQELLTVLRRQKRRMEFEAGLDISVTPDLNSMSRPAAGERAEKTGTIEVRSDAMGPARTTAVTSFVPRAVRSAGKYVLAALVALALFSLGLVYFGWGSKTGAVSSLAVLPFVNVGGDPETEYLSDGIAESLISDLSRLPDLKVMSRNSVFRYKGQEVNAAQVARELGVEALLLGRIMERGDMLNVNVELVDARDNSLLWGEQYNRSMSDLAAVQQEIARQISDKLQLKLAAAAPRRAPARSTDNSEAYHLYLRGRFYWNKRTEDSIRKGIEHFNQAIEKDPGYALAYAGLADCYALLIEYGSVPSKEAKEKAVRAAMKALEIDATLAEPHTALAAISEYDWNWPEAENQYRQAIELNPNYATAHHWYGVFLGNMGRPEEALREIRRAQELDPLSIIINTGVGRILYGARRYDEALEQMRRTFDMDPAFPEAIFQLALIQEAKGLYAEAIDGYQKSSEMFGDRSLAGWAGRVYARSGRKDEALGVLKQMAELSKRQYVSPYITASIYAAMGDGERTFEWLEKVYEDRSYYVVWLKIDPAFDGFRSDPRFEGMLRRAGLAR